jgi:hypothetical protein
MHFEHEYGVVKRRILRPNVCHWEKKERAMLLWIIAAMPFTIYILQVFLNGLETYPAHIF